MRTTKTIHVVDCHAEGEVGDVVVGGVTLPPAKTLWDQSLFLMRDRKLKDFLLNEPRGGVFRHINILVPPKNPAADIGNIILEPETAPPMSGSNTMCVVTVVLETGILPMREPVTNFKLEMPGGLIDVRAFCNDGKVERVEFKNITSFVDRTDVMLDVEGHGTITADILFGGDSFASVDAQALGFSLVPEEARDLVELGMKIAHAANEQIGFSHPTLQGMNGITFCLMMHPVQKEGDKLVGRHCVAIQPGKLDRSPTGTAVSARLAQMHARGEVGTREKVYFRSLLGSEFVGEIQETEKIGDKPGVRPTVSGRAWITGTRQLMLDPDDPWPTGYKMRDTWPAPRGG